MPGAGRQDSVVSVSSLSIRSRFGIAKPRRVIALDPGSSCLKLLLAELRSEGAHVLECRSIDLREEGLISNVEISGHLRKLLQQFGPCPVALALPQHRAICQLTNLAPTSPEDVRRVIEAETVQLRGLTETAIAYDYTPLKSFGKYQNPYWLTLCRESELQVTIEELGLSGSDLCEVTASANGLIAAYQHRSGRSRLALLIDFGAKHTDLAIVVDGQGVFASSIPFGSEAFTETIAAERGCSQDIAELFKRSHNVFSEPDAVNGVGTVARNWVVELEGAVREWITEHPELGAKPTDFEVLLTGVGSRQQGFVSCLNGLSELRFALWPDELGRQPIEGAGEYAVAYGTALHAFGLASQPTSLLPDEFRLAAKRRRSLYALQTVGLSLLLLVVVVFALGTWQKLSLINRKKTLLSQAEGAVAAAKTTDTLNRKIMAEYRRLQPVLEREKYTLDTLEALNAIQQVQSNRSLWFVLFADQQTYFSTPIRSHTNVVTTNEVFSVITNAPLAKRGFISELCVPEDAETARRTLSQIVTELKQARVFRNVDTLPAEAHRPLAEPKLLLPDKCFSLSLELAESDFPEAVNLIDKAPAVAVVREVKPGPRTFKQRTNNPSGGPAER